MRTLCLFLMFGSSLAAAQPSPELLRLVQRQTEDTYAELKARALAAGCSVPLPEKPIHTASNRLSAAASLVGGKVQVTVSAGEETWLALAGNFADRRSEVHWNKFFGAMAALTSSSVEAPAKLGIWADFEAERWGAWRWGFQTRMAFVLAHELGHACLGHLGAPDPVGADCEPQSLGIATCLTPKQCREAKADQWAVNLIKTNAKQLGVPAEGLLAGLMELALMDATAGRTALDASGEETHPVSVCRYSLLQRELQLALVRDEYLARISSIIFCIEMTPAIAQKQLERMAQSGAALCVLNNPGSPIARTTAVGFGGSIQDLHLVEKSLGVALYGDAETFLSKLAPESKKPRDAVTASRVFVGGTEFRLDTMSSVQRSAWLKTIKARPTLVPNELAAELDRLNRLDNLR